MVTALFLLPPTVLAPGPVRPWLSDRWPRTFLLHLQGGGVGRATRMGLALPCPARPGLCGPPPGARCSIPSGRLCLSLRKHQRTLAQSSSQNTRRLAAAALPLASLAFISHTHSVWTVLVSKIVDFWLNCRNFKQYESSQPGGAKHGTGVASPWQGVESSVGSCRGGRWGAGGTAAGHSRPGRTHTHACVG